MKKNVFSLVTINEVNSDNSAIINVFSRMASGELECDLKLLNYCGEIPVSYGFSVTAVEKDSVQLEVHEHQALIIKHDRYTLIKSEHFHQELGVHCSATHVNVPEKTIILCNFAYAHIRSELRDTVRVKVHGGLPVRFYFDDCNIEGCMVNISENSISININFLPVMKTDQPGLLFFSLNSTPLKVFGTFVKSTTNGTGGHICIFQMEPDLICDSVIGQFNKVTPL